MLVKMINVLNDTIADLSRDHYIVYYRYMLNIFTEANTAGMGTNDFAIFGGEYINCEYLV